MTTTPPKFTKTKGPIRFEAIVPFIIFSSLVWAYFFFLFDGHLRRGLEWGLTSANGAEVNIASLKTSVFNTSFDLQGLEITNPVEPKNNRLEILAIRSRLVGDALLRAKFVMELMSVENVQVNTPRKRPGRVLPPPPPSALTAEFERLKAAALESAKEKFAKSALGQVGDTLKSGVSMDALKGLTVDQLKSMAKLRELEATLELKQKEWGQTLAALPGDKDFDALKARIGSISVSGNPAEIPQKVAQLTSVVQESDQKVNAIAAQAARLQGEVTQLTGEVAKVDQWIAEDQKDLEAKLKIPSLDSKSIADELFGNELRSKVAQAGSYIALARKYMPAKKKEDTKPGFMVHERGVGRTYSFGKPNGYPLFWVKKIQVTSEAKHSPMGGDVQGVITHLTNNPRQIGKPLTLDIDAAFQAQKITGVKFKAELDHTGDVAKQSLDASVASFPVTEQVLSESDAVKLAIAEATGGASIKARFEENNVDLRINSQMMNVKPRIAASNPIVEGILKAAFLEMPALQVEGRAHGPWNALSWELSSNLAGALERGFQKQLSAQLSEARARIANLVQGKVGAKKREVTERFENQKTSVLKQVESRKKQGEALKAQAESRIAEVKSHAGAVKTQAVDQLKKRFKF